MWEALKARPLLTEEALLTCMAYVDLNLIPEKLAEIPETSDFTSIQSRIRAWQLASLSNLLLFKVGC